MKRNADEVTESMKDDVQLAREQVFFIAFMGVVGNIVYIHTWIDDNTDRAAWVAAMVGILLIIPFAAWILYLGKYYPNGSILDILEVGIGKLSNTFICLVYCSINITVAVTHLNMFADMINSFFLQLTPPWAIMAFMLIISVLFASGKIKSFARLIEIIAVLGVINYFLTFMFIFPSNFHVEHIIPIFDTTFIGLIKGSVFIAGNAAECLLIFIVFVRYIPAPDKHYKWVTRGIMASSIVFSIGILIIIAMMSPELAKRIAFGGVNAARLIRIGNYIQGLEVFILMAYQYIAIGKITISLYCTWMGLKRIFNNKIPRLLLLTTSILIFIPSVWLNSYNKAYDLAVIAASYIILPFSIFIIILASLCVKFKKTVFESVPK